MSDLTEEHRQEILNAIQQGRKIEAIKIYRDKTGVGLKEAKEFIEELTAQLLKENPDALANAKAGCGSAMLMFFVLVGGLLWSQLA